MPKFNLGDNKYSKLNAFYKTIYNSNKVLLLDSKCEENLMILLPKEFFAGKKLRHQFNQFNPFNNNLNLPSFILYFIAHIHYIMVNQTTEIQEQIIKAAAKRMTQCVKGIYSSLHPDDPERDSDEFWSYVQENFAYSLRMGDKQAAKNYLETSSFYMALFLGKSPYFVFDIFYKINDLYEKLELPDSAKKITISVCQKSRSLVIDAYHEATTFKTPSAFFMSLAAAGVAGGCWFFGMPTFYSGAVFILELTGIGWYAQRSRQLKYEVEQKFIEKGKQSCFNETGKQPDLNHSPTRKYTLQVGIHLAISKLKNVVYKLVRTPETKEEKARDVYVASYEGLPTISDVTLTQRKKLKGRQLSQTDSKPLPASIKKPIRSIVLPPDFKGSLIERDNGSLMIINPPASDSKITEADIAEQLGSRGMDSVRSIGMSGIKINTDGTLRYKNVKTDTRIELQEGLKQLITVDGREQSVPSYTPIRTIKKR